MKARINRERNTTGGGPQTSLSLKPAEEQINNLISETEACGDMQIKESLVSFEFEKETGNPTNISDYLLETDNSVHCTTDVPDVDAKRINDIQSEKRKTKEEMMLTGKKNNNTSKQKTPKKKLSVPARRLEKSITEARSLVNVSERTYILQKWYYHKKIELYQKLSNTMVRIATALENKLTVSPQHEGCKEKTLIDETNEKNFLLKGSGENFLTENNDASFEEVEYLDEEFQN